MIEDLIKKFKEKNITVYTSTPATEARLKSICNTLNINLPQDFKNYLLKFGSISVGSVEINGLINILDDNSAVNANFVGLSLESQQEYGLFQKYVLLGNSGLGDQWVLCCDIQSDRFGEIYYWNPGIKTISNMEKCHQNFTVFLREQLNKLSD